MIRSINGHSFKFPCFNKMESWWSNKWGLNFWGQKGGEGGIVWMKDEMSSDCSLEKNDIKRAFFDSNWSFCCCCYVCCACSMNCEKEGRRKGGRNQEYKECVAQGIRNIKTNPHRPTSNGMINKEIRKMLRSRFVRNDHHRCSPYLAQYVANLNSQVRARSKLSPNDLRTPGYNPLPAGNFRYTGPLTDDSTLQERQDIHNEYLDQKVARQLQTGNVARLGI